MKKTKDDAEKKVIVADETVIAGIDPILDEKDLLLPEVEEEIILGNEKVKSDVVVEVTQIAKELESWTPKTEYGRKVRSGEITDLGDILDKGGVVTEPQIIDFLFPGLQSDLLLIGQAKGKFGGGQRRIFRQTQKKTEEGNAISFVSASVCGSKDGYVGLGFGKSKETVPAKEKAIRSAKLNMIKVRRGCGSWECHCGGFHSIPYSVEGRSGGVTIKLMPAPKGKGLVVNSECAKMLELAGIKDVWSQIYGPTKCRLNVIKACYDALKKLTKVKLVHKYIDRSVDGKVEG